MLWEYAVEPEAIGSDWKTFKDLIDRFGSDKGRLISRFPSKWEKKVIQAAKAAGVPDVRMLSIVERLHSEKYKLADFCRGYDHASDWISNAAREHRDRPFQAMICVSDTCKCDEILSPDDCSEAEPLMRTAVSQDVNRVSADIAAPLIMLAAAAREIDLVDPYFDLRGTNGDYLGPLEALLGGLAAIPVFPKTMRIHFRTHASRPTSQLLAQDSAERTAGLIPPGLTLELCEWEQIKGGEDLHDRFFLTDVCGAIVGAGFAAAGGTETATVSLLEYAHVQHLRSRFIAGSTIYKQVGSTVRLHADGSAQLV
ncbi:hypothetical protein ACGYLI_05100 [Sulfitobacter sp. 1A13421]|uniref:hypothetical protein n=1 Tax=Sulfitobacter sp. 1A13421 TaxID=3368595 RepID=UPI003745F05D